MATCPDGHQSVATDYCDECGLSIGAPAPIPSAVGSAAGPGAAPAGGSGAGSVYGSAGEPCPNCLLPRQAGDTFCEGCGFDFANEQPAPTMTAPTLPGPAPVTGHGVGGGSGSGPVSGSDPMADLEAELRRAEEAARKASQSTTTAPPDPLSASNSSVSNSAPNSASSSAGSRTGSDPLANTLAVDPGSDPGSSGATSVNGSGSGTGTGAATGTRWVAIASADRAYYDAVVAEGEIDPTAYPFPAYCPERQFTLTGDTVRIGRTGKRGAVEIDLSGPPTDPGVSHLHAVFQQRPDGGWSVVDLESMNGTVLNDDTAPIPPNQAFPVEVGHRVHVGVWTTLTLVRMP